MPGAFLDDGGEAALLDAVRAVEAGSSAEIVIAVRRRALAWLHVPLVVGTVTAFSALAFMLLSAQPFSIASILIDPFLAGALVGAASSQVHPIVRALTPPRARRRAVHAAALTAFHERGVSLTRARTGVLVHLSLLERMAEVVPDAGASAALDTHGQREAFAAAVARIEAALPSGGRVTAQAIASLAPILAAALPRATDDQNELPDALHVERRR